MKLHICCGKRDFGNDWVHIDREKHKHIDWLIRDLDRLPLDDNSVDLIYCSHAIGYFDRSEIVRILTEWRRVLRVGGTLRLATPDFDAISDLYRTGKFPLDSLLGLLYGKWGSENEKPIFFKTTYDFLSLKKLLESVGFSNVKHYDFRETEHANFDDHSKAHLPHIPESIEKGIFTDEQRLVSLNVECQKKIKIKK